MLHVIGVILLIAIQAVSAAYLFYLMDRDERFVKIAYDWRGTLALAFAPLVTIYVFAAHIVKRIQK